MSGGDDTLGDYLAVHQRPPAFGASDGQAYTVSTLVDEDPDARGAFGAALLFVRWSSGADRPAGHLETDYLAHGPTPAEAEAPLLALTLAAVKAHLEACVTRRRAGGADPC